MRAKFSGSVKLTHYPIDGASWAHRADSFDPGDHPRYSHYRPFSVGKACGETKALTLLDSAPALRRDKEPFR